MARPLLTGLVLLGLAVGQPGRAAEQLALQDNDYFAVSTAIEPQVSPDGRQVLYTRAGLDVASDERTASFWVASVDGSADRPLGAGSLDGTTNAVIGGSARWSPDGKRIAYVAATGHGTQIHIFDVESGTAKRISSLAAGPSRLAWSPDGKTLAFLMPVAADVPAVTTAAPPAGAAWRGKIFVTDQITYRHDGAGSARPVRHHLFVMAATGGEPRQLSHGSVSFSGYGGSEITKGFPSWSPDGATIIISGRPEPDDFSRPLLTEVFAYDVATGRQTRLTNEDGLKNYATLSPDGKRIAYIGWRNQGKAYHTPDLWLMNRDGSGARALTQALDRPVQTFAWARDGRSLVLTYADTGRVKLARVDLQGKTQALADDVGGGDDQYLGNHPEVSTGPGGLVAYATQDETTVGDLAVLQRGKVRRLTHLNQAWLASRKLGHTEERWFNSTHDQLKIQAFIVTPPDFDPQRRYPLVLNLHGGPYLAWGRHYSYATQRFAAAGYVVVLPNPRGSAGYGQAFADLLQNNFPSAGGVGDFLGILEVLEQEPWIDPSRFYVTGGSGGGLETAWLTAHTPRFRAAAPCYMVSDWTSLVLTTDMPHRTVHSWFKGLPWEHQDEYWQRSPLRVVGNVKTPTLVIGGEADWRTPISQAEEYFAALKLLGVEARLVRFAQEAHGIEEIPSDVITVANLIIDWFDTHGGKTKGGQ